MIVIVIVCNNNRASNPKQARSADRSADPVLACVHWRWREEKNVFFDARTSLNDRSTYDGHFLALFWHKKWRDSNCKSLFNSSAHGLFSSGPRGM
jgi:hypothetical protein